MQIPLRALNVIKIGARVWACPNTKRQTVTKTICFDSGDVKRIYLQKAHRFFNPPYNITFFRK